jgi:alkylation response protein AidB-like acyl-CoA dehydrogenase
MTATAVAPHRLLRKPDLSAAALARVSREIAAVAPEYDRSGALPLRGLEIAHEAGLLTAAVGERWGGPGLGTAAIARILVALGEGDASVGLLAANTLSAHRGQSLSDRWPQGEYARAVERSAREVTLINTTRAEPELGAPARGGLPATVARRTPQGWLVNGHKSYSTGGRGLAYHLVWAVADEPDVASASPRVGHVVVPGDAAGIEWIDTWDHLGLRASNTHDVVYTDVSVPADAFIEIPRQPDGSYRDPAVDAGLESLAFVAIYVGVARAARSAFVAFANERVPSALGRPIAATERIQSVAGEIDAQIAQAETLLFGSLARVEAGDLDVVPQLSVIKALIVRSAVSAVERAVAALGNPALTRSGPFERLLRDVLCARVHPPQEDAALIAAGRRILTAHIPKEAS